MSTTTSPTTTPIVEAAATAASASPLWNTTTAAASSSSSSLRAAAACPAPTVPMLTLGADQQDDLGFRQLEDDNNNNNKPTRSSLPTSLLQKATHDSPQQQGSWLWTKVGGSLPQRWRRPPTGKHHKDDSTTAAAATMAVEGTTTHDEESSSSYTALPDGAPARWASRQALLEPSEDAYTPLRHHYPQQQSPPTESQQQQQQSSSSQGLASSLLAKGHHKSSSSSLSASSRGRSTILPDEDCNFFYRPHETATGDVLSSSDASPPPRRRGFRTVRQQEHQHDFCYRDAVDVLTPTVLQQYKTRYEQLNAQTSYEQQQQISSPRQSSSWWWSSSSSHPLELHESSSMDPLSAHTLNTTIVRSDTAIHSSLFYQHNGRLLMRLPVDQVRLLLEPDLEAGILSVEQWRPPNNNNSDDNDDQQALLNKKKSALQIETPLSSRRHRPPLRYVLTVSPDLYRNLVAEMSDSLVKPYCGLSRCCHDGEKADIRIAAVILAVVLLFFVINVFVWGPAD